MTPRPNSGSAVVALIVLSAPFFLSSCASRRADASPATAPPAATAAPIPQGPLSVPQTRVDLPPPQPIPAGAVPEPARTTAIMGPDRPPPEPPPAVVDPPAAASEPRRPAVPQLGRLLTAQQRREYNRVISENVSAARASLDLLARQRPRPNQRSSVERVESFLVQVEQARGSDLELARSLSDRARLLAEDLVRDVDR